MVLIFFCFNCFSGRSGCVQPMEIDDTSLPEDFPVIHAECILYIALHVCHEVTLMAGFVFLIKITVTEDN